MVFEELIIRKRKREKIEKKKTFQNVMKSDNRTFIDRKVDFTNDSMFSRHR